MMEPELVPELEHLFCGILRLIYVGLTQQAVWL